MGLAGLLWLAEGFCVLVGRDVEDLGLGFCSGRSFVCFFSVVLGLVVVSTTSKGNSSVSVWGLDAAGREAELLLTETLGSSSSSRMLKGNS